MEMSYDGCAGWNRVNGEWTGQSGRADKERECGSSPLLNCFV